jgi:fatty-acyl-CoA synthase
MTTVASLVQARAGDGRAGLLFEDQSWTHDELAAECATRAAWLLSLRRPGPFHVGVLLDNVPEFPMWLGGAALVGATVVGINPTRRGDELARDIAHTECQLIVTEPAYLPLLADLDIGVPAERVLVTGSPAYGEALASHRGASLDDVAQDVADSDLYLLLFTSGTTGAPKAVQVTQGRVAFAGSRIVELYGVTADDVCYLAMPMFHSNALFAGWSPALTAGATKALRRRFSASGFLPDVRKFGVT